MRIPFFHRLYVRLWLAVVAAVLVLALLVAWLLRTQAERIRAERMAEVPAREVVIRNAQGQVISAATAQPQRVPGRGVEFQVQLPEGIKGGEQLAIAMPLRARPEGGARDRNSPAPSPSPSSVGFFALLASFAVAVALGSYPVVRRLTQRLEGLQRGVERLGAGDLRYRVDESGQDEAAFLAQRLNRAADQIEALVQSQQTLLANASHELRSPLARIRMGVELLTAQPSEALREELSQSIAELDALIEEILLASRLQVQSQGTLPPVRERVDLLALARDEAARTGATLSHSGQAPALLQGDARLLRRLLRNLLENARRYGGDDVTLLLASDAQALRIEVLDRGPGVPAVEREKIFEPFYRSSHASESAGGVGLGLSLVRSIAQQHGGSVQCLAREDGLSGARFVVRLPLN